MELTSFQFVEWSVSGRVRGGALFVHKNTVHIEEAICGTIENNVQEVNSSPDKKGRQAC
jgi:hypothetical protein